ncbi:MAG: ATP-binding protein [Gemmatimonadota bacterium]
MPASLSLRCMGFPELRSRTGAPLRFRTRKHMALLVYLAVEPRVPHNRDFLAHLLWPDVSEAEGRHSLATALTILRKQLGTEAIEAGREHVRLVAADLVVDLDLLAAGKVFGVDVLPTLEIDSFLADFDVPRAPDFSLWRDRQRTFWLPAMQRALVHLIEQSRRRGEVELLERLADRLLHLEPLSEEGIRAKMEARALSRDRVTALRLFDRWARHLRKELGAQPSPGLTALATILRQRGLDPTRTPRLRPAPPAAPPVFVGRGSEYEALYAGWEMVREGRLRHFLVMGDSGVGKTTLIEHALEAARLDGAATAHAHCYEAEREIPYAALAALAQEILTLPGSSCTPPAALSELSRIAPRIRDRYHVGPPSDPIDGEAVRVRLAEGVLELIGAVADEQPLVIAVDDVHLADDASVAILHLVLRRIGARRVMFVLAARDVDPQAGPNVRKLLRGAHDLGLNHLPLSPLADSDADRLLDSRLHATEAPPTETVRRAIIRAASGYPMVLELMVRDWQERGEDCVALELAKMLPSAAPRSDLAEAYGRTTAGLVATLDPASRDLLNLASVLGGRLNHMETLTALGMGLRETMSAIAQLVDLRLLQERDSQLAFPNELVRLYVYESIPTLIREAIHSRVADLLLASKETRSSAEQLEVAWHCLRSGRTAEAIPFLLEGAERALDEGAPHETEVAVGSAMQALAGIARERAQLILAQAYQEQGRWHASLPILEHLERASSPSVAFAAEVLKINANRRIGVYGQAELTQATDRLIKAVAESNRAWPDRVRAATAAASILTDLRQPELAVHFLRVCESIDADTLPPHAAGQVRLSQAMALYAARDMQASLGTAMEASHLLERAGIANTTFSVLQAGIGLLLGSFGRYEEACQHHAAAVRTGERLGNKAVGARAAGNLAVCLARLGKYKESKEWAERAVEMLERGEAQDAYAIGFYALAFAHAILGDCDRAIGAMEKYSKRAIDSSLPWIRQAHLLRYADICQLAGKPAQAMALARDATAGALRTLQAEAYSGPYARWLSMMAVEDNTVSATLRQLARLVERMDQYDRIDQAEIWVSVVWLKNKSGQSCTEERERLEACLSGLPGAVLEQLERLGFAEVFAGSRARTARSRARKRG